jgi:uncharacterized membrane protein YfcA
MNRPQVAYFPSGALVYFPSGAPRSGIVVIGGLIGSELGSRRVAVATFRRLLAAVLVVAGLKLLLLL